MLMATAFSAETSGFRKPVRLPRTILFIIQAQIQTIDRQIRLIQAAEAAIGWDDHESVMSAPSKPI
jgi:hypothetical protein